jgi:hypothetical protein
MPWLVVHDAAHASGSGASYHSAGTHPILGARVAGAVMMTYAGPIVDNETVREDVAELDTSWHGSSACGRHPAAQCSEWA